MSLPASEDRPENKPPRTAARSDAPSAEAVTPSIADQLGERREAFFRSSPDPKFVHDGKTIFMANQALADALGAESPEAMVGMPVLDIIAPDRREIVAERMQRIVAGETPPIRVAERFISLDGSSEHVFDVVATPVTVDGVTASHTSLRDATERLAHEAALRESEERYRDLFEHSPILIREYDLSAVKQELDRLTAEGVEDVVAYVREHPDVMERLYKGARLTAANERTLTMYGASCVEELADPARQSIQALPHDLLRSTIGALAIVAKGGTEGEFEAPTVMLDESTRRLRFHWRVMSGHEDTYDRVLMTALDVTEERARERELETTRMQLEALLNERTRDLIRINEELHSITAVVGRLVEARDPYTAGHQRRVASLARAIARELKLDDDDVEDVWFAARVHDIGKVSIPSDILTAPRGLSPVEMKLMQEHPAIAFEILDSVSLRYPIAELVLQHHERLDGSGYPRALAGDDILPGARILAVADVLEAMASHRPYRPSLGIEAAVDEITKGRGSLYDTDVVDCCVELMASGYSFDDGML